MIHTSSSGLASLTPVAIAAARQPADLEALLAGSDTWTVTAD
jgi:hypothetical protein